MRQLLAILLFLSTPAFAQQTAEHPIHSLGFLAGEWNVVAEIRLSRDGPWETSEAQSLIHRAVGATILEEEYTGKKQGRVFSAKAWFANDNRTKKYQKVFVDSDHGVLVHYEGELLEDLLTLYTEFDLNGIRLKLRSQYKFVSEDEFTAESARSTDGGGSWDRTGTLTYKRKR